MTETALITKEETLPDTAEKELDQDDLLIEELIRHRKWPQAGIAAGYSETYSKHGLKYYKLKQPSFIKKLQERYNGFSNFLLFDIADIEKTIVEKCLENVDNVPKFRHTLKEIKQSAGVLKQDLEHGSQPVISIKNVRNLMLKAHE